MLTEHPHIQRTRIMETMTERGITQKLIVETDIDLSVMRTVSDTQKLTNLKAFLNNLALNDFADFREIEIRQFENSDEFDCSLVA